MKDPNTVIYTAAANENLFGMSAQVAASITNALEQLHSYPSPDAAPLREAIALNLKLQPEEVLIGSGSAELISLLVRTFCQPFTQSSILSVTPTYPLYQTEARALGVTYLTAPLTSSFQFDVKSILARIDKTTRLLFISNPNNPTGNYLKQEEMQRLLISLPPHVLLVLDEAYIEFVTAPDFAYSLPYLPQHPNLIILRTFSKAYGLASLRVGYMLAQAPIVQQVAKVKQPFNVNQIAQIAAVAALSDQQQLAYTLTQTDAGKQHLQEILTRLGVQWWPSEGNFLLADSGLPAGPIVEQLAAKHILVRATSDPYLFRITVGPKPHQEFLYQQLKDILAPGAIWRHPAMAQVLHTGYMLASGSKEQKHDALQKLATLATGSGSAEERISFAFARALSACMHTDTNHTGNLYSSTFGLTDMISAFGVLISQTPLVTFGHLFSNFSISKATSEATHIHILDLGIGSGLQWLHLLDLLANRAGFIPKIRFTGIDIPAATEDPGQRLRETGERLQQHASALGLDFSYTYLAAPLEEVNLQELDFEEDATLVVNSAFTLHHIPDQLVAAPDQRDRVLQQIKALKPAVFTLTEPDSEHNKLQFLPRLRESLRHYYTVFDVLDTLLPPDLQERQVIEQEFFGREIINVLSCEGSERVERHERHEAWQRRLTRLGFNPAPGTVLANQIQKTLQLHDNFTLELNEAGYTLCWKGTPVVAATAWV